MDLGTPAAGIEDSSNMDNLLDRRLAAYRFHLDEEKPNNNFLASSSRSFSDSALCLLSFAARL